MFMSSVWLPLCRIPLASLAFLAGVVVTLWGGSLRADLFVLENGGHVAGTWLNSQRKSGEEYRLALPSGGELVLAAEQVREVIRQRPGEQAYDQLAPTFADTPEGQWAAAEWCRAHQLKPLREHHLRRLLELEPQHAPAWIALGYTQIQGRWQKRADVAGNLGFQYHQGKWRLAQEIELVEERQQQSAQQLDWRKRIAKWHELTFENDRSALEARRQLSEIRDPLAVPALIHCLARDPRPASRLFYIDLLDKIDSPAAFMAVVRASLLDAHIEVFHGAVDRVVRRKTPQVTETYCQALHDPNNLVVNRAAYVLGRLEDRSAIGPLIRALHTSHVLVLRPPGSSRGQAMSVTIPKDGSSPIVGPQGASPPEPEVMPVRLANEEVHAALLKLTGEDLGYNSELWLQWHASHNQQHAAKINGRASP